MTHRELFSPATPPKYRSSNADCFFSCGTVSTFFLLHRAVFVSVSNLLNDNKNKQEYINKQVYLMLLIFVASGTQNQFEIMSTVYIIQR